MLPSYSEIPHSPFDGQAKLGEAHPLIAGIAGSDAPTKLTELNKIKPNNNFFIDITPHSRDLYVIP